MRKDRPAPFVLIPETSVGWAGGDTYISTLRNALIDLQRERTLILLNASNSSFFPAFFSGYFGKRSIPGLEEKKLEAIHLPWPLISGVKNPIQWIPDLQDIEEPLYFSNEERTARKKQINDAIEINTAFYFSSKHAETVFKSEYPAGKTIGVVRFTASPKKQKGKPIFNCVICSTEGFYYVPNNWWKHKNHSLLIDAFIEYEKLGGKKHLILTGQEDDYRWPEFREFIHEKLKHSRNIHNFSFCSLEIRNTLYRRSFCVIQPSNYEGWSTSIEESLAFKKRLIVSNLDVFHEQLDGVANYLMFDRTNSDSLLSAIFEIEQGPSSHSQVNHDERVLRFYSDLRGLIVSAYSHKSGASAVGQT